MLFIEDDQKNDKKKRTENAWTLKDSDDTFYYITGYTSGVALFGITWREMELEYYSEVDE